MTLPDIDDLDSLGGAKANAHPVEDPTTDLDAGDHNKIATNVAGATQVLPRAWIRLTMAASTGALVLLAHRSVWGNGVSVQPTLTFVSTGRVRIAWPQTVTDALNEEHTTALVSGDASHESLTDDLTVNVVPFSAYEMDVLVRLAGTLNNAVGVNVLVKAYG